MILYGQENILQTNLERALADQGINNEIVLEMDNAESVKRYVRIGIGVSLCSDFSLELEDHDTPGVVETDHLLSSLTIGTYTLKGKSQGRSALSFIDSLKEASSGGLGVVHTGQHRSVAATS